jgi:hypothetical protein
LSHEQQLLSDDERCDLVTRLRAVPLWEKTANLQAFAAALAADATGCANPLERIERLRQHVEALIADEPLTKLHRALMHAERTLKERVRESRLPRIGGG